MVEFVDIYPTLCELSGLNISDDLEGMSAVKLLNNPESHWKDAAFSQFLREGIWVAPDGKEYMGYTVRTERYRYVEWFNWETKEYVANELYDHKDDPQENVNIAVLAENEETIKLLKSKLRANFKSIK